MERWVGKIALVTGASSGIGAAIAVALADAGVQVVGLARRVQRVDDLKSKVIGNGSITPRKCDISSTEEVANMFEWLEETFGGLHIMINNAGVFFRGSITASDNMISEEDILKTFDTNVKGTVLCARHAVNCMKKQDIDGHIININSIAGHYIPFEPHFNVYPSTKYAITAFTKGLLNELAHHKNRIKVTSLSPGLVVTELAGLSEVQASLPALCPEDVARAVLYALSTPPQINIDELTVTSVGELRL